MTAHALRLLEDALLLSTEERKALAEAILSSVPEDDAGTSLSPEWREEIKRRIEAVRRGEDRPVPWYEADARIRQALADL